MMEQLLVHVGLVDQVTKPLQSISNEVQSTINISRQNLDSVTVGDEGLGTLGLLSGALKQLESTALKFTDNYKKGLAVFNAMQQLKFTQEAADTEQAASKMLTPWQQLQTELFSVRDSIANDISSTISSAIDPVANVLRNGLSAAVEWTKEFPLLGDSITFVGAASSSLNSILDGAVWSIEACDKVSAKWTSTMEKITKVSEWFRNQTALTTAATWLFNSALWASPVTWIVVGVIALGAAVAGIIYYWDDLSAAMTNAVVGIMEYWDAFLAKLNGIWIFRKIGELFSWIGSVVWGVISFQINMWGKLFGFIGSIFSSIANVVASVVDSLVSEWQYFSAMLMETAFVQTIVSGFKSISNFVSGVFDSIVSVASAAWSLLASGVDTFLSIFSFASTMVDAFFTLLISGPEAALAALGEMGTFFTDLITSLQEGWQALKDSFTGFFDALSDSSIFRFIGNGINSIIHDAEKIPDVKVAIDAEAKKIPELKAAHQTLKVTPELKAVNQTAEATPELKAAHQTLKVTPEPKSTPEMKNVNQNGEEAPELKAAHQTLKVTPELKNVNQNGGEAPELKAAHQSVEVTPELRLVNQNGEDAADLKAAHQSVEVTLELKLVNQNGEEAPELKAAHQTVKVTPKFNKVVELSDFNSKVDRQGGAAANQHNKTTAQPLQSNVISYKQPQNQTKLPANMVQNATTNHKQQSSNNRTYGDITINAQQPFTPDMLAQWEELNAG